MSELTPMLKQYYEIKSEYQDAILMFRLGDFFEMFGDDARIASKILNIVLTSRNKGTDNKIPMCGIPFHAVDNYISKLVKQGHKVAVCDQVEDASQTKGIVKREVIRVITPGTLDDDNYQDAGSNNYLLSIHPAKESMGLAWSDISTGELTVRQIKGAVQEQYEFLGTELARINPSEVILSQEFFEQEDKHELIQLLEDRGIKNIFPFADWAFVRPNAVKEIKKHFNVLVLDGFGLSEQDPVVPAVGALLSYLQTTQKKALEHITTMAVENDADYMILDDNSLKSLEILANSITLSRENSLLGVLEQGITTSMGQRLLKKWLIRPLLETDLINARLDAVEVLFQDTNLLGSITNDLEELADIQRLCARLGMSRIMPKEMIKLMQSLELIPQLKLKMQRALDELGKKKSKWLQETESQLVELSDVIAMIKDTLVDDPPAVLARGGVIRPEFHSELEELVQIKSSGKEWIKDLEKSERQKTGINSLKVRYNKVFGYYIEVTKANLDSVPEDYIRKQTLVNSERFITPELKEYEAKVLGAEERIIQLENELYEKLIEDIIPQIDLIQQNAEALARIDVIAGLARVARQNQYCKPQVVDSDEINIQEGRHPVIEQTAVGERFIPNDAFLSSGGQQIIVLTGPNMAGKSTWLRQVALITLLAQVGSFVPAKRAQVGVVDRIFTRIGAADDLSKGQSTFMVEMQETANILNNATPRSLLILDEIGRGTSTYDGLSIAWAVIEYLHKDAKAGPKTLFATHYHELIQLAEEFQRVKNFNIAVRETDGKIVFLRKILPGGVDESYGIQVAQLAGLPSEVVARASKVLDQIERSGTDLDERLVEQRLDPNQEQMAFMSAAAVVEVRDESEGHPVLQELREIKIESLTPIDALNKLASLIKNSERD